MAECGQGVVTMKFLEADTLNDPEQLYCILYWAPWAEPSVFAEQLLDDQAEDFPSISFGKVNVDDQEELVKLFQITAVPSIIFLKNGNIVGRYAGSDPVEIIQTLQKVSQSGSKAPLEERLKALINKHKFMIFIKGTPSSPRCGFTSTLLKMLQQLQIEFDSFDILSDDEVRQGLKVYSEWPTYPQIYLKGELLGGLDIFMDLYQSGQLEEILATLNE